VEDDRVVSIDTFQGLVAYKDGTIGRELDVPGVAVEEVCGDLLCRRPNHDSRSPE